MYFLLKYFQNKNIWEMGFHLYNSKLILKVSLHRQQLAFIMFNLACRYYILFPFSYMTFVFFCLINEFHFFLTEYMLNTTRH